MGNELWLSAVIAVTGAVLVGLATLVVRSLGTEQHGSDHAGSPPGLGSAFPSTSIARGIGYLYGPIGSPRRPCTVEGNFDRAVARIAAVDPYATTRRVGIALLEVGVDKRTDTDRGRRTSHE